MSGDLGLRRLVASTRAIKSEGTADKSAGKKSGDKSPQSKVAVLMTQGRSVN